MQPSVYLLLLLNCKQDYIPPTHTLSLCSIVRAVHMHPEEACEQYIVCSMVAAVYHACDYHGMFLFYLATS